MTAVSETLPAVRCTSWCEDGTGHTSAWHPDDQQCYGKVFAVHLTREPLRRHEGESWLDTVKVYLAKEREGRTHICLGRDDDPVVEMGLSEARELRDALSELLTLAEAQA